MSLSLGLGWLGCGSSGTDSQGDKNKDTDDDGTNNTGDDTNGPGDGTIDPTKEGEADESLVTIKANDADNPTKKDGLTLSKKVVTLPYLWPANHTANSISKFNTVSTKEEGRYWVGANPSRTAVDLEGNVWVGGRDDGRVTKILWDVSSCPESNGIPGVQTSHIDGSGTTVQINSAADPFADECVVFSAVTNPSFPTIRGMAVGNDGRVWIGYSNGGIQSIDPDTFALGPHIPMTEIPLWQPDDKGVYKPVSGQKVAVQGVYGLIVDSRGILYVAPYNSRNYLAAYNTRTEQWIGAYQKDGNCSYGITVDGKNRVWIGGYPACSGVQMYDPKTQKITSFLVPVGVNPTPTSTSAVTIVERGGPGGAGSMLTTGVVVEPATGNVWTSFYQAGYTGRLVVNESNYASSIWHFIGTSHQDTPPYALLPGEASGDLRGVGFDVNGYAWTLGLGSDRVYKLDPATNKRASDLPEGKSVGVGPHYTYSDFTGSTVANFTAPRGTWNLTADLDVECYIPTRIEAIGYVPPNGYMGLRIQTLDNSGVALSGWLPEVVTGQKYFDFVQGVGETVIDLSPYREYFLEGDKFQVEVLVSTGDKNQRPILNAINIIWAYDEICSNLVI